MHSGSVPGCRAYEQPTHPLWTQIQMIKWTQNLIVLSDLGVQATKDHKTIKFISFQPLMNPRSKVEICPIFTSCGLLTFINFFNFYFDEFGLILEY